MKRKINFNVKIVLSAFLLITATANLFSQTEGVEKNSGDTLDKKKPSFNAYKNSVQLDIGGAANLIKISYSRNFHLNNKFIIAPRIGLTTIGVDFKLKTSRRLEVFVGSRLLALLFIPIGKPIPFGKNFYGRYEEAEFTAVINSLSLNNYIGLNYSFKKMFIGANLSINSLLFDRSCYYYANEVLSAGISIGYKFKIFKNDIFKN